MTQNSVNYANNPDGPELLDDYLAKQQQNELTTNSGIQRPSYAVAGTKWLDTSSTPWVWKMFDGTSDIILGSIDPTTHAFSAAGLDAAVLLTGDQTVGGTKTFSNNPLVPNVSSGDSSSKVANTAFVTSVASGLQTQINTKASSSDLTSAISTLEAQIDTKATPSDVENAITGYYPKYNQAVDRASGTTYTASKNCRVIIVGSIYNNIDRSSCQSMVKVDGVEKYKIFGAYIYGYSEFPYFISIDLKAGQTYGIFLNWGYLNVFSYQEIPF